METQSVDIDDSVLAEIVHRLVAAFHPERIYLFGSHARGDAGPDSDYDLLLIVSHSDEPGYRRAQQAQEALWGIWTAADVLVLTRKELDRRKDVKNSLPETVLAEGKDIRPGMRQSTI